MPVTRIIPLRRWQRHGRVAGLLPLRRGLRVVYPITDEPCGVRRFFVEDPGGAIVNVLAHTG